MKILQLIDSLSIGGAERMGVNIANVSAQNGIESYLVASRKGGPLQQFLLPAVNYYCIDKKNGFDISAFYRLIKLVKKIRPDVIHAHSTSVYWAIGIKLFINNIKVAWHDHYGLSDSLKDSDRFWLKFLSRWINGVIVVNNVLEAWGKKHLHTPSHNIIYLKNFPFLALVNPPLKTSKTILLNLANFRPQKDQLSLVEAVNIVKQSGIDFELWLAGEFVNSQWVLAVKSRIKSLDLSKEVKILGPVENPAGVLSKATIGILSSQSEGLPVALLEYGLAGLPVICTDTGQCKEVLGNGQYGVVIPPGDPKSLAEAIIRLIADSKEATKMALAFNKHVVEEYGAEKFFAGYSTMLTNII